MCTCASSRPWNMSMRLRAASAFSVTITCSSCMAVGLCSSAIAACSAAANEKEPSVNTEEGRGIDGEEGKGGSEE